MSNFVKFRQISLFSEIKVGEKRTFHDLTKFDADLTKFDRFLTPIYIPNFDFQGLRTLFRQFFFNLTKFDGHLMKFDKI